MIIFVGDRPSSLMAPGAPAFDGARCSHRLSTWIKTITDEKVAYYVLNSVDHHLEYVLATAIKKGFPIVALGKAASKALGKVPHYALPHPSGRNLQTNNKKFIDIKLKECQIWVKENCCA